MKVTDDLRLSNGGPGAFEATGRFSAIELEGGAVRGGTEVDGTVGLNWYPDSNANVMADYVRAHATPAAHAVTAGRNADDDLFLGRLQFYW